MKNTEFVKIILVLNELIEECDKLTSTSTTQILLMNDSDFLMFVSEVEQISSKAGIVLKEELYHALGMLNFSASQISIFCNKIKKLGSYRRRVQQLISSFSHFKALREIYKNKVATFRMRILLQKEIKKEVE